MAEGQSRRRVILVPDRNILGNLEPGNVLIVPFFNEACTPYLLRCCDELYMIFTPDSLEKSNYVHLASYLLTKNKIYGCNVKIKAILLNGLRSLPRSLSDMLWITFENVSCVEQFFITECGMKGCLGRMA